MRTQKLDREEKLLGAFHFRYPFTMFFVLLNAVFPPCMAERLSDYTPSTAIERPTNTRRERASTIVVINGLATTAGSR